MWKHPCKSELIQIVALRACGKQSEGSSSAFDFYELQLQVQGFTSLINSMVGYLAFQGGEWTSLREGRSSGVKRLTAAISLIS